MGDDRELGRLLDEALARYSDVEPLAGLEERILERVRSETASPRRRWNVVWALAGVAASILLAFFVRDRVEPRHEQVTVLARGTDRLPIATVPLTIPVRVQKPIRHRDRNQPAALPEENEFPARTPMTPEERALANVWRRAPAATANLFADLEQSAEAPTAIAPVEMNNTNGRKSNVE